MNKLNMIRKQLYALLFIGQKYPYAPPQDKSKNQGINTYVCTLYKFDDFQKKNLYFQTLDASRITQLAQRLKKKRHKFEGEQVEIRELILLARTTISRYKPYTAKWISLKYCIIQNPQPQEDFSWREIRRIKSD